jgi:DNA-binding NarL/FixJ family response regulator
MDAIQVLIVEHNPSLSHLLMQVLVGEHEFELVGHASQVTHALRSLSVKQPDIIVLDVLLPDMGVLEAISLLIERSPRAKIILLADRDEARYHRSAVRYGATACIRKDHIATQLIPLVKYVAHQAHRMKLFSPNMTDKIQRPEIFHTSKETSVSNVPA